MKSIYAKICCSMLFIKHEYLRSRAYICLSLSSPFSSSPSVIVSQIWLLSRYSCCYLGSLHPRNLKNKVCLDNYWEIIASISHNLVSTKDCLRTSKYKIKPNWGQKWWWWCGCGLIFLKQALVDSHIFGRPFSHRILMTSIWIMRSFSRKYLTEKRKEKKKYCSEFRIRTVVDIIKS